MFVKFITNCSDCYLGGLDYESATLFRVLAVRGFLCLNLSQYYWQ